MTNLLNELKEAANDCVVRQTMNVEDHSRIFFIDALKALAIVLVVMGHTNGLWEVDGKASLYFPMLSVFHMPLFMALKNIQVENWSELDQ